MSEKKTILFIGSKPYVNARLTNLLDSITKNTVRHNMALPDRNNGTYCDKLYLCNHLYLNVIQKELCKKNMLNVYSDEYKKDNILDFVANFDKNKYTKIDLLDGTNNVYRTKVNNFLTLISNNTAPKLTKQIRTGMLSLLLTIIKNAEEIKNGKIKILVFGYSITSEVRLSSYVKDSVCELIHKTHRIHNPAEEVSVLHWLHKNKYIDLSLCMLSDNKNLSISAVEGLQPSKKILNILKEHR